MAKHITFEQKGIIYHRNELSTEIGHLAAAAEQATAQAYAPYSNFLVGAALLLENGEMVRGSNQENAAYPSGLCAERTAFYYAGSAYGSQQIKAVCIAARRQTEAAYLPVSPCGSCRQAMLEYELKQAAPIQVFLPYKEDHFIMISSVSDLLPLQFSADLL